VLAGIAWRCCVCDRTVTGEENENFSKNSLLFFQFTPFCLPPPLPQALHLLKPPINDFITSVPVVAGGIDAMIDVEIDLLGALQMC
jgi:hypothetical protein